LLKVDTKFTYKPYSTHQKSHCRLRVYQHEGNHVVVATELDDNPGVSITKAAEELVTVVANTYDLSIQRLIWVEHHPANGELGLTETFELVRFTWLGGTAKHPT
jgi:hypothetical protein